jgi:hypothetical protein
MAENINVKEYSIAIDNRYVKKKYRKISGKKTREIYFDIDEHILKDIEAKNDDANFLPIS